MKAWYIQFLKTENGTSKSDSILHRRKENEQGSWPFTYHSTSKAIISLILNPLYIFILCTDIQSSCHSLWQLHKNWHIILHHLHKLYLTYIFYMKGTNTPTINCQLLSTDECSNMRVHIYTCIKLCVYIYKNTCKYIQDEHTD